MLLNLAIVFGLLSYSFAASAVEYSGYMRSGIGGGLRGSDQACFRAPGSEFGTARLGNECSTYIEAALAEKLTPKAAESLSFKTHLRLSLISDAHRDFESATENFTLALREAFVEASGSDLHGMNIWVGKRFYRRMDIHMFDYYFVNNSGPGAGVENISLGSLKLHLAMTRNVPALNADIEGTKDGPVQTNIDLRLSDINLGGKLEVMVISGQTTSVGYKSGDKVWEKMSGTQFGIFHRTKITPVLSNFAALQYGTGIFGANAEKGESTLGQMGAWDATLIARDDKTTKAARDDSTTARFINQIVMNGNDSLSGEFALLYQTIDFGGAKYQEDGATEEKSIPKKSELTFGVRPIYHLTKITSLALEYSNTSVKKTKVGDDYKDTSLQKTTLAAQLAPDSGYWVRPQLRLFLTHASWNDAAKAGGSSSAVYKDTSGWSAGAQFEAWW